MTKTFIGVDSVGVPCVKITKGQIDPFSEPDADAGSFLYNSKWAKDIKINFLGSFSASYGDVYEPAGSASWDYKRAMCP
jgi:hypothetical protein